MMINIVLFLIGIIALFFGIKEKLKYLIVIGTGILVIALLSAYFDYKTTGTIGFNNNRVPFVIDKMM